MFGHWTVQRPAEALLRGLRRFLRRRRGNVGVMTALLIVPVVGAMAMATEGSAWFLINRAEQSAADTAALAAAANNDAASGGTTYTYEGKAAAAKLGFTDGSNNSIVSISYGTIAAIPACAASSCYQATVTHKFPLLMSALTGYGGNSTIDTHSAQSIQSVAVATAIVVNTDHCITAVGKGSQVTINGGPKTDLGGCTVASAGDVTCNGTAGIQARDYVHGGTDKKCDPSTTDSTVVDPYDPANGECLAPPPDGKHYPCYGDNIPKYPVRACSGSTYPQEATKGKVKGAASLPAGNLISSITADTTICGDAALASNVTVSAGGNYLLTIENGGLDLNGHTLQTASGAGLTVLFSGTNGAYDHIPFDSAGGGVLDIAAPANGSGSAWAGVAMWQDNGPNNTPLTSGVGVSFSGSSPTLDFTGLVYLPNSTVTISGAIDKASNGLNCFAIIVNSVTINGTGSVFSNESRCHDAGLVPPSGLGGFVGELVY